MLTGNKPDQVYKQITVRLWGKGLSLRGEVAGSEIAAERQVQVTKGQFLISKIDARHGAFGIIPPELEGSLVSNDFPAFDVDDKIVFLPFFEWLCKTEQFFEICKRASTGSTNRVRLNEEKFREMVVPIPNLQMQKEIVSDLKKIEILELKSVSLQNSLSKVRNHSLSVLFKEIAEINRSPRASTVQVESPKTGGVESPVTEILLLKTKPTQLDQPFKEAVLVSAIIKAIHEEGGQPLGNFRLQKAVYFARRFMGESALDQQYLRKAAGPYNPSMCYSGGVKIALEKNWIAPATGKFGPGHSPGSAFDDASAWIEKYQFAEPAAWVRDKFKFKQNDIWELLATVDYAMLALEHAGSAPTAANVFAYIGNDEEWRPKIEKLRLSEASIQNAMVELQSLFVGLVH